MKSELTGRKTLAILLVSFGIVFGVNGYMVAQAIGTFRGDDLDQPYMQGINFNQTLARRAEQQTLGWQATIDAARATNGELKIVVVVKSRDGAPLALLRLSGVLRHPTDAHFDRKLVLKETQSGVYVAALDRVSAGAWNLDVFTDSHSKPFEATRSLWLR